MMIDDVNWETTLNVESYGIYFSLLWLKYQVKQYDILTFTVPIY